MAGSSEPHYFTDGRHLYEVVADRTVQNFGLTGGVIRSVILRDCVSERIAAADELYLTMLSEVRAA